jgi:hypothetical protein
MNTTRTVVILSTLAVAGFLALSCAGVASVIGWRAHHRSQVGSLPLEKSSSSKPTVRRAGTMEVTCTAHRAQQYGAPCVRVEVHLCNTSDTKIVRTSITGAELKDEHGNVYKPNGHYSFGLLMPQDFRPGEKIEGDINYEEPIPAAKVLTYSVQIGEQEEPLVFTFKVADLPSDPPPPPPEPERDKRKDAEDAWRKEQKSGPGGKN